MFGSVEPTPYDLRFVLAGMPVRVSIWFWVAGAVLGYSALEEGIDYLLAWLLVLFISILVHEMGHALAARAFGYSPRILLYQFGGLAMYEPWGNDTRGKAILIALAGPWAGFVLYGLTVLLARLVLPNLIAGATPRLIYLAGFAIYQMEWINLWWGLVNLLPVLPLDGGNICQELCSLRSPSRGREYAVRISAVVAGLFAAYCFLHQETYAAILFALLCSQNVSALQPSRWR